MSAQIERLDGAGDPAPRPLPQPGWRLLGVASIGVGSGLYTASAPPALLVVALAVATVALLVICFRMIVRLEQEPTAGGGQPETDPGRRDEAPPAAISNS